MLLFPSARSASQLVQCLQDLPNLSKPQNALLLKVALESLSFGNGGLQNEKNLFCQETNFFCQVTIFFCQETKIFVRRQKSFVKHQHFFVELQNFFWHSSLINASIMTLQSIKQPYFSKVEFCRHPVNSKGILLIAHLIRPPGSVPGVGRVRCNQTNKKDKVYYRLLLLYAYFPKHILPDSFLSLPRLLCHIMIVCYLTNNAKVRHTPSIA